MLVVFRSCKYCYYYGKVCGLGLGKIVWLFKKRNPEKFTTRKVALSDLIPDFLVGIFPIVGCIILAFLDFSFIRIGMIILLMILSFGGTAIIRDSFSCKYCKKGELCCPSIQLFNRKNLIKCLS